MASAADSAQNVEFRFNCLIGAIYTDFTVLNKIFTPQRSPIGADSTLASSSVEI